MTAWKRWQDYATIHLGSPPYLDAISASDPDNSTRIIRWAPTGKRSAIAAAGKEASRFGKLERSLAGFR